MENCVEEEEESSESLEEFDKEVRVDDKLFFAIHLTSLSRLNHRQRCGCQIVKFSQSRDCSGIPEHRAHQIFTNSIDDA